MKGEIEEGNRRDRGRDERSSRHLDLMSKLQQDLAEERQKSSGFNLELQRRIREVKDMTAKVEKLTSERDSMTSKFHSLQLELQSVKEELIETKSESMMLANSGGILIRVFCF